MRHQSAGFARRLRRSPPSVELILAECMRHTWDMELLSRHNRVSASWAPKHQKKMSALYCIHISGDRDRLSNARLAHTFRFILLALQGSLGHLPTSYLTRDSWSLNSSAQPHLQQ